MTTLSPEQNTIPRWSISRVIGRWMLRGFLICLLLVIGSKVLGIATHEPLVVNAFSQLNDVTILSIRTNIAKTVEIEGLFYTVANWCRIVRNLDNGFLVFNMLNGQTDHYYFSDMQSYHWQALNFMKWSPDVRWLLVNYGTDDGSAVALIDTITHEQQVIQHLDSQGWISDDEYYAWRDNVAPGELPVELRRSTTEKLFENYYIANWGKELVVAFAEGQILFFTSDGTLIDQIDNPNVNERLRLYALSPDNKKFAFVGKDAEENMRLYIYNFSKNEEALPLSIAAKDFGSTLLWLPNSTSLIYSDADFAPSNPASHPAMSLYLYNLMSQQKTRMGSDTGGSIFTSSDSRYVFFADYDPPFNYILDTESHQIIETGLVITNPAAYILWIKDTHQFILTQIDEYGTSLLGEVENNELKIIHRYDRMTGYTGICYA